MNAVALLLAMAVALTDRPGLESALKLGFARHLDAIRACNAEGRPAGCTGRILAQTQVHINGLDLNLSDGLRARCGLNRPGVGLLVHCHVPAPRAAGRVCQYTITQAAGDGWTLSDQTIVYRQHDGHTTLNCVARAGTTNPAGALIQSLLKLTPAQFGQTPCAKSGRDLYPARAILALLKRHAGNPEVFDPHCIPLEDGRFHCQLLLSANPGGDVGIWLNYTMEIAIPKNGPYIHEYSRNIDLTTLRCKNGGS